MTTISKVTTLALTAGVLSFSGCAKNDVAPQGVKAKSVEFIGMKAPKGDDMARTYSDAKVKVTDENGKVTEHTLSYNTIFNIKDKVAGNKYQAGQIYNYKMEPVMDPFGKPVLAETPDANSLLNVDGKLYLVSHLEYDWILSNGKKASKQKDWYSRMPMAMTLTSIDQKEDGSLKATAQKPIDFSSVNGIWIPCFGSQTPWNTHLGSEEDYDLYYTSGYKGSKTKKGLKALSEVYFKGEKKANPYHYGFITEVEVKKDGATNVTKHYAMGKGTWEMAKVLDDGRTVYFGDDGRNVAMFMFIADEKNNLDTGTLYAAKWSQVSLPGSDGGSAELTWIKLGHQTSADVKMYADKYTFDDIFESKTEEETGGVTPKGFKALKVGHKYGVEYLKLKPGMEKVAAALEPRRYAAYLGATTEFNKMEGIAFNEADKKLYMAISYIKDGMLSDDSFKNDDIQVKKNNCGGTYEIALSGHQKDQNGDKIVSDYVATFMSVPEKLLGQPIKTDANGNTCAVDSVANTDNVFFSEKMRTLFIGEDSGTHTNNFLWAYNVDTKKLSRLLSLPAGAESTGLQVVENENGHAYIMSNAQHLADFTKTTPDSLKEKLGKKIDKFNAPVGYIGGIPGIK
jgi:secreted PhoX family phosphatase